MKTILLIPILGLSLSLTACNNGSTPEAGGNESDTASVVTGLDTPWEILWGPDDYIWVTERPGYVSRVNPETGEKIRILTIHDVLEEGESGLLGMVLHPDFPDSAYVYLVYDYYSGSVKERLVRYTYDGSSLVAPMILLDGISGGQIHNGSRLLIDKNYKLFMTTGETGNGELAQDLSSLNGKILRLNLDGSIPDDNPFPGSYVWSYGHRNPQGIVMIGDRLYISEHGPTTDDEINLVEKGRNYGWPDVHGYCDLPSETDFCEQHDVMEPLYTWTPTIAPAGMDYYNKDLIPEWKGHILLTTLKESELLSLELGPDGQSITDTRVWFDNWFGRLRDVCIAPDGRVFIATSNYDGRGNPRPGDDRIIQITGIE